MWPHSWIVLRVLTLQLGDAAHQSDISSGCLNHLPEKVPVAEPFGPGFPGAPVPSGILQAPEEAGSRPIPSPVMGWVGSLVTKALPPPSGPENPPLLSLGYPGAQRAYLEADLDCWPWPCIRHP